MKSIGAEFLQPDVLPGINHMREIQYEIVANVWWCVQNFVTASCG